jgi:hypothetical protein
VRQKGSSKVCHHEAPVEYCSPSADFFLYNTDMVLIGQLVTQLYTFVVYDYFGTLGLDCEFGYTLQDGN